MNFSDKSFSQEQDGQDEYDYGSEQQQNQSEDVSEPQKQEIEDYARFLGMDPEDSIDMQLLWIAKRGLLEPV